MRIAPNPHPFALRVWSSFGTLYKCTKDKKKRDNVFFQTYTVHSTKALVFLSVKMQDRVRQLSQAVQCGLVGVRRQTATGV